MYIDTHAHIYLDEFKKDWEGLIADCKEQNVIEIYLPNIDETSITQVHELASRYPETCKPMMGLHPCYVKENYKQQLETIYQQFDDNQYAAIGEIGIDLHWDLSFVKEQIQAFEQQIEWAKELKLPFAIHSRKSLNETISMVEKHQNGNLKGVFHCFNGTIEEANRIMDAGFMMGIGGVATFKNAGLDDMLAHIHENNIVLETDAPYLAPHPHRGKQNTPVYLPIIAHKLAEVREETINEVAAYTTKNARQLFEF